MAYQLGNIPAGAPGWIVAEFRKLQEELSQAGDGIVLNTLYAAPAKPREGLVIKADGATYDPGSGAGIYQYRAGAWVFIG